MKKLYLLFCLFLLNSPAVAQDEYYSSGGATIDVLLSGGYTAVNINNSDYIGYSAVLKTFFPFMGISNVSIGVGIKYDDASYKPDSKQEGLTYKHQYDTLMLGVDFGYKLDFSWLLVMFNPFIYYSFYDTWLQTTDTTTYQQTYSPYVIHNVNVGIGLHLLYKFAGSFYAGPSAYYSGGYMVYQNTLDSKGNSYQGGEGSYSLYSLNLTLGMYF